MQPLVWIGAAILAALLEIASPTFGFIFVSLAAVIVAGAAWLGFALEAQLLTFAASMFLSLAIIRPRIAKRLLAGRPQAVIPSRTEVLVGEVAEVTQAIDPVQGTGRVLVAGQDWAAKAADPVERGTRVIILGADGIVLNVTPEE